MSETTSRSEGNPFPAENHDQIEPTSRVGNDNDNRKQNIKPSNVGARKPEQKDISASSTQTPEPSKNAADQGSTVNSMSSDRTVKMEENESPSETVKTKGNSGIASNHQRRQSNEGSSSTEASAHASSATETTSNLLPSSSPSLSSIETKKTSQPIQQIQSSRQSEHSSKSQKPTKQQQKPNPQPTFKQILDQQHRIYESMYHIHGTRTRPDDKKSTTNVDSKTSSPNPTNVQFQQLVENEEFVAGLVQQITTLLQLYGPLTLDQLEVNMPSLPFVHNASAFSGSSSVGGGNTSTGTNNGENKSQQELTIDKGSTTSITLIHDTVELLVALGLVQKLRPSAVPSQDVDKNDSGKKTNLNLSQASSCTISPTRYAMNYGIPRVTAGAITPRTILSEIRQVQQEIQDSQRRQQILVDALIDETTTATTTPTNADNTITAYAQINDLMATSATRNSPGLSASIDTGKDTGAAANSSGGPPTSAAAANVKRHTTAGTPYPSTSGRVAAREALKILLSTYPEVAYDPVYVAALRNLHVDVSPQSPSSLVDGASIVTGKSASSVNHQQQQRRGSGSGGSAGGKKRRRRSNTNVGMGSNSSSSTTTGPAKSLVASMSTVTSGSVTAKPNSNTSTTTVSKRQRTMSEPVVATSSRVTSSMNPSSTFMSSNKHTTLSGVGSKSSDNPSVKSAAAVKAVNSTSAKLPMVTLDKTKNSNEAEGSTAAMTTTSTPSEPSSVDEQKQKQQR